MHSHQHHVSSIFQRFLQKVDSNALLLDCLVAVFLHDHDWKRDLDYLEVRHRHIEMVELLRSTAPDIVVLDMPDNTDLRHPMVKGSIAIPDCWADRWDKVMGFEPKSRLALVLEAVMMAMMVHQLAHWLADLDGPHSLLEGCRSLSLDDAAKLVRPELKERGSTVDPGDYIEVNAGGGMIGFDDSRDDGVLMLVRCPMRH